MKVPLFNKYCIGYTTGIGSGMTWGLDTVIIGLIIAMPPFTTHTLLIFKGFLVCSMLHDAFAAIWMLAIEIKNGEIKYFPSALKSKDGKYCILGAFFGGPLAMSFYFMSISTSGPALTATVTACYPLLGSIMAVFILKEHIQLKGWLGLLFCIAGIIFIGFSPKDNTSTNIYNGIILSLVASIGWATEAVVCGYGMKSNRIHPRMALLIRELTSALIYSLLVVPITLGSYINMVNSLKEIFSYQLCWLFFIITAFLGMSSFLMWYTSINHIGASKALCFNVTYSIWAVIFTFLILHTTLTFNIIIGAISIIVGVSLSTLTKHKQK